MDTRFETVNENRVDANAGGGDARADYGGDLSSNDGVDLNTAADNSADTKGTLSKSGFTRGFSGAMAGVAGVSGAYAPSDNQYAPPPNDVPAIYQEAPAGRSYGEIDLSQYQQDGWRISHPDIEPPSGSQELPHDLNPEYDDGKFDPNRQHEISDLGNAERGSEYGDHTDPPETTGDETGGEDLNDNTTETGGDDTTESEGGDTAETEGDGTAEAEGDGTAEAEGGDTAEAEGDDTAETEGDDTVEAEGDDTAETEGDDTADIEGDTDAEVGDDVSAEDASADDGMSDAGMDDGMSDAGMDDGMGDADMGGGDMGGADMAGM